MHRSSASVAAIATALAKAQIAMANPEKSMIGTINHSNRGNEPQKFRYAPLSSGLEIVRKTLGAHQIAITQTTDIDQTSKAVNLTTLLLHTSGEWISSIWPVCALSEIGTPRRMGAALTYARRYALFTMVGIAGEDDPDLDGLSGGSTIQNSSELNGLEQANKFVQATEAIPFHGPSHLSIISQQSNASMNEDDLLNRVAIESSRATPHEQLTLEISSAANLEELEKKAASLLKCKNRLPVEEARNVEILFASRLNELRLADSNVETPRRIRTRNSSRHLPDITEVNDREPTSVAKVMSFETETAASQAFVDADLTKKRSAPGDKIQNSRERVRAQNKIDKSLLTIGEPRRHRNKAHLKFVGTQACLICGRAPSDAHHLRFAQPRAMGKKTSDEFTVPLCRTHHRDNHRTGDEISWWANKAIDPLNIAAELWSNTRLDSKINSGEPDTEQTT